MEFLLEVILYIIGSILLEPIGAFFRWLFEGFIAVNRGEEPQSFIQIWQGNSKSTSKKQASLEFSNRVWGFVSIGAIIACIAWLF